MTELMEGSALTSLVRKWGGVATDAILDPSCKIFFASAELGFIAYRLEPGFAVVIGDPVSPQEAFQKITEQFIQFCHQEGLEVIWVVASDNFKKAVHPTLFPVSLEFGEILSLNPQKNPLENTGTKGSLVRRKVKHAAKEGVIVQELTDPDSPLQVQIEEVGEKWLNSRRGPQVHISHVHLFDHREGKRWFYATRGEAMVGVVLLNKIEAYKGWLLNHLMITPEAPNGTPESLVVAAIEAVGRENGAYLTFGAVPREDIGEISGLNLFAAWAVRLGFKVFKKIFGIAGLKNFWIKFLPEKEPSYLLFSQKLPGPKTIQTLLKALNVKIN